MEQRAILTFLLFWLLTLPTVSASRSLESTFPKLISSPQDVQEATVSAQADEADSLVVPDGTPLRIEVLKGFSSEKTKEGDVIDFAVALEVRAGGVVLVPQRTSLVGKVVSVSRPHRRAKDGQVEVAYEALTLPTGETVTVRPILNPPHKGAVAAKKAAEVTAIGATLLFTEGLPLLTLFDKGNEEVVPEGTLAVVYLNGPLHISRKAVMAHQPDPASGYAYIYVGEGVIVRRRDLGLPKLFCGEMPMYDASRGLQLELSPGTYWFSTDDQNERPARVDVLRSHEYILTRNRHGLVAKEFQAKMGRVYPHRFVHKDLTRLTTEEYRALAAEPANNKNN
jgi:hypothetical protein